MFYVAKAKRRIQVFGHPLKELKPPADVTESVLCRHKADFGRNCRGIIHERPD